MKDISIMELAKMVLGTGCMVPCKDPKNLTIEDVMDEFYRRMRRGN